MLYIKLNYSEAVLRQIYRFSLNCAQQHLTVRSQEYDAQQHTIELAIEVSLSADRHAATRWASEHFAENLLTVHFEN